jgi:hypothetical protein
VNESPWLQPLIIIGAAFGMAFIVIYHVILMEVPVFKKVKKIAKSVKAELLNKQAWKDDLEAGRQKRKKGC